MLNSIVPPPIPLASLIAWRSEPMPLSSAFITIKAAGVLGLGARDASCATAALDSFRMRDERVPRDALAKVDTTRTEQTNKSVIPTVIRSANAPESIFVFILGAG